MRSIAGAFVLGQRSRIEPSRAIQKNKVAEHRPQISGSVLGFALADAAKTEMLMNKFKRETGQPSKPRARDLATANVLIVTREQAMAGNVSYEGTVQVDGLIEGDVTARRIVVTADATVNGTVKGKTVRVDGTVNGPIDGGTVILAPTACVKGNIDYDMLNIVSGASVFGLCRDKREARPAARLCPTDSDPIPFNLVKNFPRHSRALPPHGPTARRPVAEPGPRKASRPESMMDVWESYTQDEPSVV